MATTSRVVPQPVSRPRARSEAIVDFDLGSRQVTLLAGYLFCSQLFPSDERLRPNALLHRNTKQQVTSLWFEPAKALCLCWARPAAPYQATRTARPPPDGTPPPSPASPLRWLLAVWLCGVSSRWCARCSTVVVVFSTSAGLFHVMSSTAYTWRGGSEGGAVGGS